MRDEEPEKLADRLEHEIRQMEQESRRLEGAVSSAREDWEHKRSDPGVPGAPPPEGGASEDAEEPRSPAPQAPPETEAPGEAETAPEMAAGPPADGPEEAS